MGPRRSISSLASNSSVTACTSDLLNMRNLGLRSSSSVVFADAKISAVAIDLEENATYVASDRRNADANVEIEIWKIDSEINGLVEVSYSFVVLKLVSVLKDSSVT